MPMPPSEPSIGDVASGDEELGRLPMSSVLLGVRSNR